MTRTTRLSRAAVPAAAGVLACVPALTDDLRPVQSLGLFAAVVVVAATATGWRLLGTFAVVVTTASLLTAGLTPDGLALKWLLVAGLLVTCLAATVDRCERSATAGGRVVVLARGSRPRLSAPWLVASGAAAGVAAIAGGTVVPSVWLALIGLAASLGALVVALRPR